MHEEPERHRRGPTDPAMLTLVRRLATLPRQDGDETRIELQQPPNGPPVVACRVWRRTGGGDGDWSPLAGHGLAFRNGELATVIGAFVEALDWFREDERAQRLVLSKRNADRRRERRRDENGGPAAATGTEDHEPPPAAVSDARAAVPAGPRPAPARTPARAPVTTAT